MFQAFKSSFSLTSSVENTLIEMKNIPFKYKELLLELGGKSFDDGLYTIHSFAESLKWSNLLSKIFEKYDGNFLSFGHDWMGRQFCVSKNVGECIYMFDPATFEDFYIDTNLFDFHNSILTDSKIDSLSLDVFNEVKKHLKINSVKSNECIGFKTPLFLNGKREIANYEIYDLGFSWDFEYQLYQQVKNLPDGTMISAAAIDAIKKKD